MPDPNQGEYRAGRGEREPGLGAAWLALAVLVITMLGFAGATVYARRVAARLNDDVIDIAANASPAIEHASAAREQVLRLAVVAAVAVERSAGATGFDRAAFTPVLARLRQETAAYLSLPFFPHEQDLYGDAATAIAALESAVTRVSAELENGNRPAAAKSVLTLLMPAAEQADRALGTIVAFNAEQQHRLALQIPQHVSYGDRIGYLLQGATGLLGLLLMGLVLRAIRQYGRLQRARQRLADAHARDVAAFGTKLESIIRASVTISEAITAGDDTNHIFRTIADQARFVVNAQYCAVGSGTDPQRPFDPWVTSGAPESMLVAIGRPPCPNGLLGAVEREGPIRVAAARAHPAFRGLPPGHPEMGPFLGLPIVHAGQNLANLYLARSPGQPPFTEEDQRAAELLAGYVGVAIVNARLLETALAARQAREDLLATVSHDLKNPLNAIRLALDVLRRKAGGVAAIETSGGRIERSVDRMERLIGGLLDAAKIEAGALRAACRPEKVAPLIEAAVDQFRAAAARRGIELASEAPPAPVAVLCERDLVLRVLGNLIGNALKFSPEHAVVAVRAAVAGESVELSVSDAGPGIPAEHLPHVFDRYWQQKDADRRGSGLGLYIAKGIVDAHGGRIWIDTATGKGTTVHFTLPVAGEPDAAESAACPPDANGSDRPGSDPAPHSAGR